VFDVRLLATDLIIISHCVDYCNDIVLKSIDTGAKVLVYEHKPFYPGMYQLYPSREAGYMLAMSDSSLECGIVSHEFLGHPSLRGDNLYRGIKILACGGASLYYIDHFILMGYKVRFKANNYDDRTLRHLEEYNGLNYTGKHDLVIRFGSVENDEIEGNNDKVLLTAPYCMRGSERILRTVEQHMCDPTPFEKWKISGVEESKHGISEYASQIRYDQCFYLRWDDEIISGDASVVSRIMDVKVCMLRSRKACKIKCSKCNGVHVKVIGYKFGESGLNLV